LEKKQPRKRALSAVDVDDDDSTYTHDACTNCGSLKLRLKEARLEIAKLKENLSG